MGKTLDRTTHASAVFLHSGFFDNPFYLFIVGRVLGLPKPDQSEQGLLLLLRDVVRWARGCGRRCPASNFGHGRHLNQCSVRKRRGAVLEDNNAILDSPCKVIGSPPRPSYQSRNAHSTAEVPAFVDRLAPTAQANGEPTGWEPTGRSQRGHS